MRGVFSLLLGGEELKKERLRSGVESQVRRVLELKLRRKKWLGNKRVAGGVCRVR